jgi:PAS domain S-box-containing protein
VTGTWNPRDAVVITRGGEPDRRIIYVNRAFCALTGYQADEVIGEDGDLLISDGPLQAHSPQWLPTDASGHDVHWVTQLRHRDGRAFQAEAHLTPMYGAEGKRTHYIVVLRPAVSAC